MKKDIYSVQVFNHQKELVCNLNYSYNFFEEFISQIKSIMHDIKNIEGVSSGFIKFYVNQEQIDTIAYTNGKLLRVV